MLTIPQKKKHLLLLNRIMRTELKKDIIPTPSKLSEEQVETYFKRLFVEKDGYWAPVKNKVSLDIDENLFKELIKKPKIKEPKAPKEPKKMEDKEAMKEIKKQKEKEDKEAIKEMKKQEEASNNIKKSEVFTKKFIFPYTKAIEANMNANKEKINLINNYVKLDRLVKNIIKTNSPKLWEAVLNPADIERDLRKKKLSEEAKIQMENIREEFKKEKMELKKKQNLKME